MTAISGPQDVGGACPPSLIPLNGNCCCDWNCCWSYCPLSSPPLDCLTQVQNATWYYHQNDGYFSAIIIEKIV